METPSTASTSYHVRSASLDFLGHAPLKPPPSGASCPPATSIRRRRPSSGGLVKVENEDQAQRQKRYRAENHLHRSGSVPPTVDSIDNGLGLLDASGASATVVNNPTGSEVDLRSGHAPFGLTQLQQQERQKLQRNSWKNRANKWQWLWNRKSDQECKSRDSSASSTHSSKALDDVNANRPVSPNNNKRVPFSTIFNRAASNASSPPPPPPPPRQASSFALTSRLVQKAAEDELRRHSSYYDDENDFAEHYSSRRRSEKKRRFHN